MWMPRSAHAADENTKSGLKLYHLFTTSSVLRSKARWDKAQAMHYHELLRAKFVIDLILQVIQKRNG